MLWDPHPGAALVLLCHHSAVHLQVAPLDLSFPICSSHNPRERTTEDRLIDSLLKYFVAVRRRHETYHPGKYLSPQYSTVGYRSRVVWLTAFAGLPAAPRPPLVCLSGSRSQQRHSSGQGSRRWQCRGSLEGENVCRKTGWRGHPTGQSQGQPGRPRDSAEMYFVPQE